MWAQEDMAVDWRECAPSPPVRIEVGPPKNKKHRVEPPAVSGDRPLDVIPQPAGAPALPAPVSDDHEMGLGAGAPALPAPVSDDEMGFDSSSSEEVEALLRRPAAAKALAKAHAKAHAKAPAKAHAKAPAKAHPKARGMQ